VPKEAAGAFVVAIVAPAAVAAGISRLDIIAECSSQLQRLSGVFRLTRIMRRFLAA
jgi:hypothetical protein